MFLFFVWGGRKTNRGKAWEWKKKEEKVKANVFIESYLAYRFGGAYAIIIYRNDVQLHFL